MIDPLLDQSLLPDPPQPPSTLPEEVVRAEYDLIAFAILKCGPDVIDRVNAELGKLRAANWTRESLLRPRK
jgi:hypothetical protein